MELSEHARVNRDAWNEKASGDIALAERQWARDEISWGIWNVPESEVGALPDVARHGRGRARVRDRVRVRLAGASAARGRSAIDVSENQLATARAMQAEHGLEFPLIHASAEDVPLPGDSADLVDQRVRREPVVRPGRCGSRRPRGCCAPAAASCSSPTR